MIASLRGTLVRADGDKMVVDVGGVGFRVHIPLSTARQLPGPGETVAVHIYTHVREDALALYGFATEDERRLFEDIIGVSGAGPRLALTALSTLATNEFRRAIVQEDVAVLTRISGVGKKTAQRLILELKGKLTPVAADDVEESAPESSASSAMDSDALAALVALGYSEAEAMPALKHAVQTSDGAEAADTATLLRRALRHLAG